MGTSVRILFYAVNGTGLGHLNRLLVMARTARDLVECRGDAADFRILTTSEADAIAWDFPTYKLPSKTVINESATSAERYAAEAKMLIGNLTAGFRPDILVMDTLPQGSFHEFLFLKDYARACVFVDRHKDLRVRRGNTHAATLSLYDLILAPDDAHRAAEYPIPGNMEDRRVFTGPIVAATAEACLSPEAVRAYFGVPDGARLIYVSAGGGGDREALAQMETLVTCAAADPRHFVLAGYGPLFRGPRIYQSNVVPLSEADVWRFFPGLDMALCSAGYNSYQELLACRVPCAFFAQNKGMDRQDQRIERGLSEGLHLRLEAVTAETVRAAIARLSDADTRHALTTALARRTVPAGRVRAAVELLRLHADLAKRPDARAELCLAAARLSAWLSRPRRDARVTFAQAYRAARLRHQAFVNPHARTRALEAALVAFENHAPPTARDRADLDLGLRLAHLQHGAGLDDTAFKRLLAAYARTCRGEADDVLDARTHHLLTVWDTLIAADPAGAPDLAALLMAALPHPQWPEAAARLAEALGEGLPVARARDLLAAHDRMTLDQLAQALASARTLT